MDERTEDLRDLFVDVTDTETVTEDQEPGHGTLSDPDEVDVERRLRTIVDRLREAFPFETALDIDQRVALIRAFYRGESDAELAERLSVEKSTVVAARLELHLFRESDTDAPIEWDRLRHRLGEADDAALAAELDLEPAAVERYRRVRSAREAARSVSHRFRSAYRDVIPDADLADRLTADATEDGLEEAAADIETDVSF